MRPTNLNRFTLPTHRLERSVDALVSLIARHGSALCFVAIFAIWGYAQDQDYHEQVAQATDQRDELIGWVSQNHVRVTLEGDPARVANLAQQVANVIPTERK